jgi:asparagine synthetase B (glutamine-hydrolysing)
MRVIVVSVARAHTVGGASPLSRAEPRIAAALGEPPWTPEGTTRTDRRCAGTRRFRIDVTTNEPATTGPLIHRFSSGWAAAWTGHIDDVSFTADRPTPATVADLAGSFALLAAGDDVAVAATTAHRMEPLYVAAGAELLVVSNSARAAHRIAGLPHGPVPLEALIGLSGAGFMLNDVTPFPGVSAVPAGSFLRITPEGVSTQRLPEPDIDPDAPLEEVADSVSRALTEAAAAIARSSGEVIVRLTGGKDSRLAAAALAAAGARFTAVTSGVPSHPDVVLASKVAATLGVPHEVGPPAGATAAGDVVAVCPVSRAYRSLRGCDNMLTTYETIGLSGPYADGTVTLGGHGGELLRGGFAYGVPPASEEVVIRRFRRRVAPHQMLLSSLAREELERMTEHWRAIILSDPHRGSDVFYREIRNGRWHAVANSVYSIAGPRRSLLADNRAVRLVSAWRPDHVAEERLAHAVLHRLHPDLCQVPLTKRWRFERHGPTGDCDANTWSDREPPAVDSGAAWNWKVSYPVRLHDHLAEVILSSPLYDYLLRRSEVDRFLAETRDTRTAGQAKLAWALYTVGQLLNGLDTSPKEPVAGPRVDIPIPPAEPALVE